MPEINFNPYLKNQDWFGKNINPESLYKISLHKFYDENQLENCIQPSQLDIKCGFIHASYGRQVKETVEKFFNTFDTFLIIELDKNELVQAGFRIEDEENKVGGPKFPHIYDVKPLPKKAILKLLTYSQK